MGLSGGCILYIVEKEPKFTAGALFILGFLTEYF